MTKLILTFNLGFRNIFQIAVTIIYIFILLLKEDLENLAEELRPVTKDLMKIEMAPWIKGYVADMNDLYTDLEIDKLGHKPKTTEKRTPLKDYTELFQHCIVSSSQVKRGEGFLLRPIRATVKRRL